jgi:ribosomal protein L7/L12
MRRIEAKIDLILRHLGLNYEDAAASALSPEVRALADDPARKIEAIKVYREQTGAGLKDAKDAVEAYIAARD